ncbi:hypothetical protein [Actinomadura macra]|uniref:hypothetical protein n=1 Tax=Actinomadura macra TaxID=46164 RepID=UPI00082BDEFB|nr:hypothetical protein [Actinomadura macra]
METVPTHRGALRPRDRYALLPALTRLVVIAGFAAAGWLVLSALNDTASAAPRGGAGRTDPASSGRGAAAVAPPDAQGPIHKGGLTTLRHLTGDGRRPAEHVAMTVEGDMRALGNDPVTYMKARGREVLDDRDRAVGIVRDLAATGVHRLRVPAVRTGGPIGGLVPEAAGSRPLKDGLLSPAHSPGLDVPLTAGSAGSAARDSGGTRVAPSFAGAVRPGEAAIDGRRHYRGEHHAPASPGPVLPSGQDDPRGGALSGGHQFGPIADLRADRHAAVPPAPGAGMFHRSALADMTAPDSPTVVPD